ncbi:geranylgeranyl diphosphate synthase type I [Microbacteriaceae bacterium SG_E_30_P1]|uniref:Geranylgeranyl diphosphate synthase type I n=1 Tax=Antiquaquibacter oligotrophicus TaxID=2880260 RepID=A0ABT6KLB3_9MICO|nr:polyprenyl synthetase family protein [Antiquaquibacter oligotrophicus]MDH6180809.1 geranylgeranyl diphosphate synthase type I [Antiquaquibacter oligotrophicus]UDF13474.1 polyprenyl synthetase family protein [Antiquaquibacter oligotrophicus]
MPESTRLVDVIQLRIDEFIARRRVELLEASPQLDPVVALASDYLAGGKRFRGLFCYWGWQAVAGSGSADPLAVDAASADLPGIVLAASALEVFHAAALVHDDIMDNSDTRRGAPSAHRRFEMLHREGTWAGSPETFGRSAALLLGDLLLGWSDDLFDSARTHLPAAAHAAGRREFARMRTDVSAGQYLDILEENAWVAHSDDTALSRAHRVIVYKSAKYTIEAPLAIGGSLGGGSDAQLQALRSFGLPLGVAYQLRDDLLGVFGDPEVTGKPAGDDVREGKRTVLIALARQRLSGSARNLLDELLGDPSLDASQIDTIRSTLTECGAVDAVEEIINHNVGVAIRALDEAPLSASARSNLRDLAATVTARAF